MNRSARTLLAKLVHRLARAYLDFALRSTHWTVSGDPRAVPLLTQAEGRPVDGVIVAFWHRSVLLLPALCRWGWERTPGLDIRVMISRNRDGRFINDLIAPWGIKGVEGSSDRKGKNKGGSRALRKACGILRGGAVFAITPDGPRGPAEQAQPGAEALVRLSGRPLVPVGASCTSLRLPTWDGLRIPLPFGRGVFIHGAPLGAGMTTEDLTASLSHLSQKADRQIVMGAATALDRIWSLLGRLLMPTLRVMMLYRLRRGKEIASRLAERRGRATLDRPDGDLLWLHAASVGECNAILPLVAAIGERRPALQILLTTATVTGASIVSTFIEASPERRQSIRHQFIPYDVAFWTRRFLSHWRPSALLLTDSELWPGLIWRCARRAVPVGVLNARLSARSWSRWYRFRLLAAPLFRRLTFVAARSEEDARHFHTLGVRDVVCYGDLKQTAPPLPDIPGDRQYLEQLIGTRPVFLAASTHPGEEEIVLRAAARARQDYPDLLTIIVPRHPVRGDDIASLVTPSAPRRSLGCHPLPHDPVAVFDTLGELGMIYRLADCTLIGNSLLPPGGGHNPFEPIRLGTVLATGPHTSNFTSAFAQLGTAVTTIQDETQLAGWIIACIRYPERGKEQVRMASALIETQDSPSDRLLDRIDALLCG